MVGLDPESWGNTWHQRPWTWMGQRLGTEQTRLQPTGPGEPSQTEPRVLELKEQTAADSRVPGGTLQKPRGLGVGGMGNTGTVQCQEGPDTWPLPVIPSWFTVEVQGYLLANQGRRTDAFLGRSPSQREGTTPPSEQINLQGPDFQGEQRQTLEGPLRDAHAAQEARRPQPQERGAHLPVLILDVSPGAAHRLLEHPLS